MPTLKLIIDKQSVELPEKVALSLIFRSPLFNSFGSRSNPVNLSGKSLINQKLFNFPSRISKKNISIIEKSCLLSFGVFQKRGIAVAKKASDKIIETLIKTDAGEFASLIEGKFLKDIDFGSIVNLGTTTQDVIDHANDAVTKDYPDINHNFPMISAPNFYGEEKEHNEDYSGYINNYEPGTGFEANAISVKPAVDNPNNLVPMPYLVFVMKKCFETFGYTMNGETLFNDSEFLSLLIINNYALDQVEKKYFVRAAQTSGLTIESGEEIININDDSSGDNEDDDNCFNETGHAYKYVIAQEGYHHIKVYLEYNHDGGCEDHTVSEFKLKDSNGYLLDSFVNANTNPNTWHNCELELTTYYGVANIGTEIYVTGNFQCGHPPYNATGGVRYTVITVNNVSACNLNRYQKSIDYRNHVPNWTIKKFLAGIEDAFGIVFNYDNTRKIVNIKFWKEILSSIKYNEFSDNCIKNSKKITFNLPTGFKFAYAWSSKDEYTNDNFKDISDYDRLDDVNTCLDLYVPAGLNKIIYVKNINAFLIYSTESVDTPPSWKWLTDNFLDHEDDNYSEEYNPGLTPLTMDPDSGYNTLVPRILQLGTSPSYPTGENDFDFHVLFYRGLRQNNQLLTYPLASSGCYDVYGNKVGNYSLSWDGDDGLIEKFWKEFVLWSLTTKFPVEYKKKMNDRELHQLNYSEKYRIEGIDYLINSINVTLLKNQIKEATLKLFKV